MDLENFDHCIVQFTVGGDDGTQNLVPDVPCNLDPEGIIGNDKQSLSSEHESTTKTSPTEPSKYNRICSSSFIYQQSYHVPTCVYNSAGCVSLTSSLSKEDSSHLETNPGS